MTGVSRPRKVADIYTRGNKTLASGQTSAQMLTQLRFRWAQLVSLCRSLHSLRARACVSPLWLLSKSEARGSDMSKAVGLNSRRFDGSRAITPMFFLTPLVTSAVPRLTWLFFFLVAIVLILPFLRQGGDRRQLIRPSAALIGVLLVALYALISAMWAANPSAAFGEASLLLGVILTTFIRGDPDHLRRGHSSSHAG